eukprot:TRINITY_DN4060_c0_g1_i1.p1 TRINITY_DN4060_c0_g1~~TRINITY_DN4060_c0_g1_i1.p1  ORF type:complete len:148 (-),score=31.69 TRINITY_DN4060_c0_g1_i1:58-501(-)
MNKLLTSALFALVVLSGLIASISSFQQGSLYARLLKRALLQELEELDNYDDYETPLDYGDEFDELDELDELEQNLLTRRALQTNFPPINKFPIPQLRLCRPRCGADNTVITCPNGIFGAPQTTKCGYKEYCAISTYDKNPYCYQIIY